MKRCSAVISNETSINHQSEIRRTHSPLVLVRGNAKAGGEGGALHVICSSSIGPSAQTTYAIFEDCESGSVKGNYMLLDGNVLWGIDDFERSKSAVGLAGY
ncbi:hypothetical protein BLNAU_11749 [Blattamonas nauphoetae]|uniref:Uncharacterized protein n=1 Tax=Blattamonas nauphoetae TaxID=2049346 RepID=A0ABQ9XLI3_9EUKA|nr:hypothetical protein BLNAU_11749 [Blattamonas nauphoetae]